MEAHRALMTRTRIDVAASSHRSVAIMQKAELLVTTRSLSRLMHDGRTVMDFIRRCPAGGR